MIGNSLTEAGCNVETSRGIWASRSMAYARVKNLHVVLELKDGN